MIALGSQIVSSGGSSQTKPDTNIIFETILENDSPQIVVDNLDILRDGGHYQFELISSTSNNNEIQILINGLTDGYYQSAIYITNSTSSSHDIVPKGYYAKSTQKIDGWLVTAQGGYPSITIGDIWLTKNYTDERKALYHVEHSCSLDSRHSQVNVRGIMAQNFDNITSLTFKLMSSGNYTKNTKLVIRKVI